MSEGDARVHFSAARLGVVHSDEGAGGGGDQRGRQAAAVAGEIDGAGAGSPAALLHDAARGALLEVESSGSPRSLLSLDDELEWSGGGALNLDAVAGGRSRALATRAGGVPASSVLSALGLARQQRAQQRAAQQLAQQQQQQQAQLGADIFSEVIAAATAQGADEGSPGGAAGAVDAGAAATAAVAQLVAAGGGQLPEGLSRLLSPYRAHFEELRALGRGGFGEVVAAVGRLDGRLVAVKRVPFRSAAPPWAKRGVLEALHDDLLREARALALADHPNLVRYHSAWIEPRWERLVETVGGKDAPPSAAAALRSRSWHRAPVAADPAVEIRELSKSPDASDGMSLARRVSSGGGSGQGDATDTRTPPSRVISDPLSYGSDEEDYLEDYTDTSRATREGGSDDSTDGHSLVKLVTPAASAAQIDWPYCLHISMELCEGVTLAQWLEQMGCVEERPLAPVMCILGGLIRALDYIHSFGWIHRDIKPSNIFVLPGASDMEPHVKVCFVGRPLFSFVSVRLALLLLPLVSFPLGTAGWLPQVKRQEQTLINQV